MNAAAAHPRLAVAVMAALGIALRLAYQIRTDFYVAPPVFEEDEIARNILAGGGHTWQFLGTTWSGHTGLFPSFLALLHMIGGGPDRYVLIGVMQAAISVVVVTAAYYVGSRLWSRPAGLLAAAAVTLHPGLIVMPARGVISPVYDQAVAASMFVCLLSVVRRPETRRGAALGLAMLVAALLRPTIGLAAQVAVLPLLRRAAFVPVLVATALFTSGSVLLAAWTQLDHPAGARSGLCLTLWVGNNRESAGGAFDRSGRSQYDAIPVDLRARLVGKGEAEQGQAFCDAVVTWAREDPLRAVAWQATKYWYFWWFGPAAGLLYPERWIDVYRVVYVVEVALAVLGAIAIWRRGWREGLLMTLLFMALMAAFQAAFYVEGRHRLLVEVGTASLAATGLIVLAARTRTAIGRAPRDAPRERVAL